MAAGEAVELLIVPVPVTLTLCATVWAAVEVPVVSAKTIVPAAHVDPRWSGQVIETNDGLPYIGTIAERQFVATGFSGNGMTFGTLAGMMA